MHVCLLVPELAAQIAEACAPGYKSRPLNPFKKIDRSTVCALARTCRTLQGPALNVIWYRQTGLNNLVNLLPPNLWERVIYVDGGKDNGLSGVTKYEEMRIPLSAHGGEPELSARDLDRFDFYAPRVRKLEVKATSHMKISADAYERLCALYGGGPLLPKLQSVVWEATAINVELPIHVLKYCVSPTVLALDLSSLGYRTDDFIPELTALPLRCPNVQSLTLELDLTTFDLSALLPVIEQWKYIHTIDLSLTTTSSAKRAFIGPQLLSELATISKLHKLKFCYGITYTGSPDKASSRLTFDTLETLAIVSDAEAMLPLFKDCSFPSLRYLDILSYPNHPVSLHL